MNILMSKKSIYLKQLVFALLTTLLTLVIFSMSGCKDKPKKKSAANVELQKNKAACTSNFGNFQNSVCNCVSGYEKIPGDLYRCSAIVVAACPEGAARDVSGYCPAAGALQAATSQECYQKTGYWQAGACNRIAPTSQQTCVEYGDVWNGGGCSRREPNTKRTICERERSATWDQNSGRCSCNDVNLIFDWSLFRCYGGNGAGGTDAFGKGKNGAEQYSPDMLCYASQGQWNGNYCMCPQNSVYNQATGYCEAMPGQYQGNCPGQYDQYGKCVASGQQLVFSILFGWVAESLFLTSPDANPTKKSTDGH